MQRTGSYPAGLRTKRLRAAALATGLLLAASTPPPPVAAQDGGHLNRAIELLESDQPAFGVLSFDYSLQSARTLASSDLDFIIIDMEHAPYDVERLRTFLLGMTDKRQIMEKGSLQMNVTPFVRVPATGPEEVLYQAKQVLDVGVFGVMYPSISTRAEAEHAVSATRYPQARGAPDFEPAGLRGRNPTNAIWFWGARDYMQRADVWPLDPAGDLLAILQIETPEGVANVEDIVSVPGVGVIFIGPSDLTAAMGFPPQEEVEAAIQRVLRACLAADVPCAITTSAGSVEQRIREGFRFVTVGTDGGVSGGVSTALERGHAASGR
jgi:4-hydroxy-2-oxoheptanedioate aldolase